MFLHLGLIHYGFNTLFLFRIGMLKELDFGSIRYTLVYVSGFGNSFIDTTDDAGREFRGDYGTSCRPGHSFKME